MHVADFLVFALFAILVKDVTGSCPEGWTQNEISTDHCFHYIIDEAEFEDAYYACHHVGGEMTPAVADSDTAGLAKFLNERVLEQNRRNVWLNMMYNTTEGKWTSKDGSDISLKWYEGYPEGDGDCGVFLYSPMQMKNKLCSLKSSFVCIGEKDKVDTITSRCPAFPQTGFTQKVLPGTWSYLSCEERHEPSSEGHKKTFCQKNGSWSQTSAELATCQATSCIRMVIGKAVQEISSGGEEVGVLRNFTCPPGTSFRSEKDSINIIIECKADGTWAKPEGASITKIEDCVDIKTAAGDGSVSSAIKSSMPPYLVVLFLGMSVLLHS